MAERGQPPEVLDDDLIDQQRQLAERLSRLRQVPLPPSFSPEATRQFRAQLRAVAPATTTLSTQHAGMWPWPMLGRRLAASGLAILLALFGTTYVAASSLPGESLYPVKRQVEELQVAFAPPAAREPLRRALLDERLGELERMLEEGAPTEQVATGVTQYGAALAAVSPAAADEQLGAQLARHEAALIALERRAAPQAAPLLQGARGRLRFSAAPGPGGRPEAPPGQPGQVAPWSEAPGGRPEAAPGQSEVAPGRPETTPGQMEATPGRPATVPDGPGQAPGRSESEATPGRSEAAPGRTEATPGGAEQNPAGPNTAPGKPEGAPGRPEPKPDKPAAPPDTSATPVPRGTPGRPEVPPGQQPRPARP